MRLRIKQYVMIVSSIVILLTFTLLANMNGIQYDLRMEYYNDTVKNNDLYFSVKSGFYDSPIDVEICAPTNEIYYTLDGSEPTENSIRYTEPLHITDATEKDNIWSMRRDLSVYNLPGVENLHPYQNPGYHAPQFSIDKCTTVKAVYRDMDGNLSIPETANYFIGFEEKEDRYGGMYVVCLSTEPENLFGYEDGILVLGKTYDNFKKEDPNQYYIWWRANYRKSGKGWERPASIQVFDESKNLVLSQECGVRVRGNASRALEQHSLNIYARDEYDGNHFIYYDFWKTGFLPDQISIQNGGNAFYTLMPNVMVTECVSRGKYDFLVQDFTPCVLFLNGEYWGVYHITEKINKRFISSAYNVNEDDLIIYKNGNIESEPNEGDESEYEKMLDILENSDMSVAENYEKACEIVDMNSLVEYYACNIYVNNFDCLSNNNFMVWRTREKGNGEYEDGKWRWIMFDVDQSFGYAYDFNSLSAVRNEWKKNSNKYWSKILDNLCTNTDFQRKLSEALIDMGLNSFNPEYTSEWIDNYCDLMLDPLYYQGLRFYGDTKEEKIMASIDKIKVFFENRFPYILNYIDKQFTEINTEEIVKKYEK